MPSVLRQFVLNGDAGSDPDEVLRLPGSAFALSDGTRSITVRRLWLDTFDWRLYRSGLALEQVSSRGGTQLVLTGRDGTVIAAEQAGRPGGRVRWPARLDALPLGPLRDHLGPVAGVRALLPVARAVSTVRDRRVLNSDDKTVARLTVDRMSVTYPAAGDVAPRLAVTALRGYQTQAQRMIDLLAATPGVANGGSQSALEAALAAAGRRPGDYSSKIDVRLAPGMPAAVAMAAVLTALLHTLEANVNGTVRDLDTEFLHDLRIAVRRTRSALKLAGDVLPGDLVSRFRAEFKWLGDLTTPTRDLDVYLSAIRAWPRGCSPRRPTNSARSTITCSAAAPGRNGNWSAAFARRGSPGWSRNGAKSWRARRPGGRGLPSRGSPQPGLPARTAGSSATAARLASPRHRRACTSCGSGARSCVTCWSSSPPCTTLPTTGGRYGT
ncbi:MAG TPA: CHAD domain-containing protein [Streptosporangiaceae bacterium]|nr:CHAD domain-containing protein [Streptosporangiaceae bacterium]